MSRQVAHRQEAQGRRKGDKEGAAVASPFWLKTAWRRQRRRPPPGAYRPRGSRISSSSSGTPCPGGGRRSRRRRRRCRRHPPRHHGGDRDLGRGRGRRRRRPAADAAKARSTAVKQGGKQGDNREASKETLVPYIYTHILNYTHTYYIYMLFIYVRLYV